MDIASLIVSMTVIFASGGVLGFGVCLFKKGAPMFRSKKETKEIWESLHKTVSLGSETAEIAFNNTKHIKLLVENQTLMWNEMRRLIVENRYLKNELASMQCFIMDKVIQREE